jgi:hypothetical protein
VSKNINSITKAKAKAKAWRRRKSVRQRLARIPLVRDRNGQLGWWRDGEFVPIRNQEWAEKEYRRRGFTRMPRV